MQTDYLDEYDHINTNFKAIIFPKGFNLQSKFLYFFYVGCRMTLSKHSVKK